MLDHAMLIAGTAVRQAATHTAAMAERIRLPQASGDTCSALVAVFAQEDFRAASWLRGSFHPRIAEVVDGKPVTLMKTGFTLAF